MQNNLRKAQLFLMLCFIGQYGISQTINIQADNYKQEFIGVGASAGYYFESYFKNSKENQEQICKWLAKDLAYKCFKTYDGELQPKDAPEYFDNRAKFCKDLLVYRPDIEFIVCMNQVSKIYQDRIDKDEAGIYDTVATRYFDIIEAYYDRGVTVGILELLNEPGGEKKVLNVGKVYAYAVLLFVLAYRFVNAILQE